MEHVTQNNPSTLRDYDKDPIVIEDYNPLFLALFAFSAIPIIILIYIFNPGGTSEDSLARNVFVILPLLIFPYIYGYFKAKGKRTIVLNNSEIKLLDNSYAIEKISLAEITDIRRTYSDLYHKSQYEGDFGKFLSILFLPFVVIRHCILIVSKFLFHILLDRKSQYRFNDAIIIFSDEKLINILPKTSAEYKDIEDFFSQKIHKNISDLKVFFELSHLPEKINLEGDK